MSEHKLFDRFAEVKIGDYFCVNNDQLKIKFDVPFDDDTEPNESTIEIYNLSNNTISKIKKNDICTITAGYKGDTGVILSGRVSFVQTKQEGVDKCTTIYVLDSEDLTTKTIESKKYSAGISASNILKDLAKKIGLQITVLKLPTDVKYSKGWTCEGEILGEMEKVANHCGASAYINKGKLYIRPLTEGDDINFILSPETGLLGSPSEFYEEKELSKEDAQYTATQKGPSKVKQVNDKKVIEEHGFNITSLLQHRITTASLITLNSKYGKGSFRVRSGAHKFDDTFITEMVIVDRGVGV